ncbi:MAG: hypothetical protein KDC33_08270 [Thermoleophilia bacterium]|nr:hypothetical protein [Thermoleophilia bacterium]
MPVFICPRCARRQTAAERHAVHQPRGCPKCGFGFVFELMDDYYAAPNTALIVCDQQRRIIAAGHAATAVTGYRERDLLGEEVSARLGLAFADGKDPVETAREWGVRQLEVACTFRPAGLDADRAASLDVFPAYDDDGGLLLALTPAQRTAPETLTA